MRAGPLRKTLPWGGKPQYREERFYDYFDNAPDFYHSIDRKGIIIECNRTVAEALGYRKEELIGRPLADILTPDSVKRFLADQRRLKKEGVLRNLEREFRRKDGSTLPVILNVSAVLDEDGEIAYTRAISRDISEQKRAEEELRLLQRINNALNMGTPLEDVLQMAADGIREIFDYAASDIYLLDRERDELVYTALSIDSGIKKAIERITGLRARGLRIPLNKGSIFTEVVEKKEVYTTSDIVRVFEDYSGNSRLKPLAARTARLSGFKSVARCPLMAGDEVIGIIGVARKGDIGDEDAQVLQRFASQLALAVRKTQAEEELKRAYRELKTLDETKSDIIANVSHELRTPLTIASAAMEMAMEEEDKEVREELLSMAKRALERQNRIVGDLIAVAQFHKEEFRLNMEEVNLAEVAAISLEETRPQAREKGIDLEGKVPEVWVWADFQGIVDVLLHLLDNAVKFTEPGGRVRVWGEVKGKKACIWVEDTGIGIPEECLGKIFDRLYQVEATAGRRFPGTGMGLAVAKEMVEAMGGRITVESEVGRGSRFCVALPVLKEV
jgi:PAS domain S-box-containing protein